MPRRTIQRQRGMFSGKSKRPRIPAARGNWLACCSRKLAKLGTLSQRGLTTQTTSRMRSANPRVCLAAAASRCVSIVAAAGVPTHDIQFQGQPGTARLSRIDVQIAGNAGALGPPGLLSPVSRGAVASRRR